MTCLCKAVIAVLIVMQLTACATTMTLDPSVTSYQDVVIEGQSTLILSLKEHAIAIEPRNPNFNSDDGPSFVVEVVNGGNTPIVFSPDNIIATYEGSPVDVLDQYEVRQQLDAERNQVASGKALSDLLAFAGGMVIAYSEGVNAAQTGATPDNSASTSFMMKTMNKNAAGANIKAAKIDAKLKASRDTIIEKRMIPPGESYGGVVQLSKLANQSSFDLKVPLVFNKEEQSNYEDNLRLLVYVGKEIHEFNFHVEKVSSED